MLCWWWCCCCCWSLNRLLFMLQMLQFVFFFALSLSFALHMFFFVRASSFFPTLMVLFAFSVAVVVAAVAACRHIRKIKASLEQGVGLRLQCPHIFVQTVQSTFWALGYSYTDTHTHTHGQSGRDTPNEQNLTVCCGIFLLWFLPSQNKILCVYYICIWTLLV